MLSTFRPVTTIGVQHWTRLKTIQSHTMIYILITHSVLILVRALVSYIHP